MSARPFVYESVNITCTKLLRPIPYAEITPDPQKRLGPMGQAYRTELKALDTFESSFKNYKSPTTLFPRTCKEKRLQLSKSTNNKQKEPRQEVENDTIESPNIVIYLKGQTSEEKLHIRQAAEEFPSPCICKYKSEAEMERLRAIGKRIFTSRRSNLNRNMY